MSAETRARVVVVGSTNLDLLAFVERLPAAGETIGASELRTLPGGKGANQAVGAARFEADVSMVGMVGDDAAASVLREAFAQAGVRDDLVGVAEGSSGQAMISVAPDDVTIVVVPGANAALRAEHVEAAGDVIGAADVLMLQGEVGAEPAERAALIAAEHGTLVVFNPAPFNEVARAVTPLADVLIVNETEASLLASAGIAEKDERVATLTTLGAAGCRIDVSGQLAPLTEPEKAWLARCGGEVVPSDGGVSIAVGAPVVDVVDTTGAGDAFCGAVGVLLAEASRGSRADGEAAVGLAATGLVAGAQLTSGDVARAAVVGVYAGALAVTRAGAQAAMADRFAVEKLLERERCFD